MRIVSSFLFVLLCELLFILPGGLVDIMLKSVFSTLHEYVISIIAFLCSGVVVLISLKVFFNEIFLRLKNLMQFDGRKIGILSASFMAIGLVYSLIVLIGLKIDFVVQKEAMIKDTDFLNVLLLLSLFFVAATVEEIVFRGADLSYLTQRLKPWVSMLIISVVFSLGHMQYSDILPYITLFLFGIVTSFMVIKTNTLYWVIGMHCGWNFAYSMYSLYFDLSIESIPHWGSSFELLEIGILMLVFFSFWIYSRSQFFPRSVNEQCNLKKC